MSARSSLRNRASGTVVAHQQPIRLQYHSTAQRNGLRTARSHSQRQSSGLAYRMSNGTSNDSRSIASDAQQSILSRDKVSSANGIGRQKVKVEITSDAICEPISLESSAGDLSSPLQVPSASWVCATFRMQSLTHGTLILPQRYLISISISNSSHSSSIRR